MLPISDNARPERFVIQRPDLIPFTAIESLVHMDQIMRILIRIIHLGISGVSQWILKLNHDAIANVLFDWSRLVTHDCW